MPQRGYIVTFQQRQQLQLPAMCTPSHDRDDGRDITTDVGPAAMDELFSLE